MNKLIIKHTSLREYISRQAVINGLKVLIRNTTTEEEFNKLLSISAELSKVNQALINKIRKDTINKVIDNGVVKAIYLDRDVFCLLVEKNDYTYVKQISQGTCL